MPSLPYVVVVDLLIKPEHAEAFLPLILENAASSLAQEPGCLVFDVCQADDNATKFLLYEVYVDEAAFQRHLKTDHFLHFDRQTAPHVVSKAVRTLARLQT